ncbi:MAG: sigma-70 family RNA polymerase sigma factor [Planctomycetes bacterium]|nr:sigma-70 family RNA polymerase sigma factor [Planctomycetota bacterium]
MTSVATCWTLIEGAADGAKDARDLFVRRYGPVVKVYLMSRWHSRPELRDLDDALQDVFLECFKEGGALEKAERRRNGGFRAFLFGVTRNVAVRCEQRRARLNHRELLTQGPGDDLAAVELDPDLAFDRAWAQSTVREALEMMRRRALVSGDEARARVELLECRFQRGMPIREIAAQRQVPAARIHHDYAQARREFHTSLRDVVAFDLGGLEKDVHAECRDLLRLLQEHTA